MITVLWGIFREPGRAPVDEDRQQLSGKKLELEAPVEDSEGIDLRWRCSEPNATFEVLLYDPAVGEHVALAEAEELNTTRWYIDAKVARTLPPNTIWRVTMRVGGRRVSEERALR
ncbi:MAG: hypothetical protein H6838_09915 [Planctomycetes bacterium]|nr:hypothetical protein [Planctomycetota bacterium]